LYRSYPPQPDIPRSDHLLPSAAATAKKARAEEEAEGEAGKGDSSEDTVKLDEALPPVPRSRRVVHKGKLLAVEVPRYVVVSWNYRVVCVEALTR
jgi:hypothetical protein